MKPDQQIKKTVVQVCALSECDKKEITAKVGTKTHTFCCQKGFEKTLKDFEIHINKR